VHSPLGLPLRRFRPPLPAQLEFTDNRPTYVFSEKVRGEVVGRSVAWVSSGEWWQADRAWARSEWDFALSNGGLYRIVLVGERYFIEGEYD
jgi:protein ImuB